MKKSSTALLMSLIAMSGMPITNRTRLDSIKIDEATHEAVQAKIEKAELSRQRKREKRIQLEKNKG